MDYRQIVRERAQAHGVDPNIAEAVMMTESGGKPDALSPAGAYGPMQLMEPTARGLGVDRKDPLQNIDGGVRYLKENLTRFNGDVASAVAAYNAGPGRVSKSSDFAQLPPETRNYVPKVMNMAAGFADSRQPPVGQPTTTSGQPAPIDIGALHSMFGKASAANDQEAVAEIGGALTQQYGSMLKKAQAAGDQEAVAEITQAMSSFGKPAVAPVVQAPTPQAPPQVAPQVAPAPAVNPAAAISTEQPLGERINRGISLGSRGVLQGLEKAATYPVRAVGEAVSGVLGLAGQAKAADYVSRTVGMKNPGAGALVSDVAGLATPQTKTEKTINAGIEGASGLLTGTGLAPLVAKAPKAIQSAASILLPGASGSAGQVVKDATVYGGLSASMEAAPAETAAGLALLAAGKAGAGRYATSRGADKLIKNAGGGDAARMDAEIISDIAKTAKSRTQRGQPVTAVQLNALESKYINDVNASLKNLGSSPEIKAVKDALMNRRVLTADQLFPLRNSAAGDAAADAILKAQRARSLTAAVQSSGGIMPLLREGVDLLPLPAFAQRGLKAAIGGRQTREIVAERLTKQGAAAEKVLERLGPSSATQSLQTLRDTATNSATAKQALAKVRSVKTGKATDLEKTINKARDETQSVAEDAMAARFAPPSDVVSLATPVAKAPGELGSSAPILRTIDQARNETGSAALDTLAAQQPSVKGMAESLATQRPQGTPQGILSTVDKARAETGAGILDTAIDRQPNVSNLAKDFTNQKAQGAPEGILNTIGKAQDETNALFNKGMDGTTALKNEIKNVTTEGKIAKGTQRETLKIVQTQETKKVIDEFTGGKLAESMGEKAPGFTTMLKFVDTDAPTLTKALQDYAKQNPTRAQAAVDIMTLGGKANRQQFYRIQQDLQNTFGSKVVASEAGVLSAASNAGPVRNPISYAESVRTAGEAADLARASAPTKELAQFATTVAGIKAPADKATAIAERLAKTSDPAEAAFLTQFVEPLAKFGKKTKK